VLNKDLKEIEVPNWTTKLFKAGRCGVSVGAGQAFTSDRHQEVRFMKKLSIIVYVVLVALFLAAAPGFSQDQDKTVMPQSGKGACKADIEKFCKDIKPGGGRVWACLKSNEDRLSKKCADHLAREREKSKEFNQACKDDFKKFCKGIPSGKGRISSCLKSHQAELSDTCRAVFQK